jgi:hypothetical protein
MHPHKIGATDSEPPKMNQVLIHHILILLTVVIQHGSSLSLRRKARKLQSYYFSTSDASILGTPSIDVAIRNPLKGLLTSPRWTGGTIPDLVPSSLEFYYIGKKSSIIKVMENRNDTHPFQYPSL